jgi:hypothetical protein
MNSSAIKPLLTPDGRYMVIRERLWRVANPNLSAATRDALVHQLMDARRAVKAAKASGNPDDLKASRHSVNVAKISLGERGPVWWTDDAKDFNRHLVKNSPYSEWHALAVKAEGHNDG